MVICGRPLAITGGHLWFFGEQVDGADAGREAVRRLMKEGADFIKITATGGSTVTSHSYLPSFTAIELAAIIDETHRHGKLAATHAAASAGIENALDAGVDMLIHCNFFLPDGSHEYRPDLVDRAVAAGTWINPTLYAWGTEIEGIEARRRPDGTLSPEDQAEVDASLARVDLFVEMTGRMLKAGAKVMAGSDTPWRYGKPAWGLAREIGLLGRTGMSNRDAIVAGTSGSAESIGVGDIAGRLAPGRQADIAVFAGDVFADLGALERPVAVFQAGRPFEVAAKP
jgi:imidazolonepropionase-like amidohydrolase